MDLVEKYVMQAKLTNDLQNDPLIQAISLFVSSELDPLRKEIAKLKERLDSAEQRGLEYVGIFQRAVSYRRGTVCTHDGSIFIALEETGPNEIPGENPKWQLAVKSAKPKATMA